jgi:proline iminopeptidase
MHRLLAPLMLLSGSVFFSNSSSAQQKPASTGVVNTTDVDLAYETYGAPGSATPVIIANGGPGLSHIYMLQNDRLVNTCA